MPRVRLDGSTASGGDDHDALPLAVEEQLEGSTSWIVDGGNSAAQTLALLSLPLPPTHWVLCTVDDAAAEKRGRLADRKAGGDGAAVREELRRWKLQMMGVYALVPASTFLRVDTSVPVVATVRTTTPQQRILRVPPPLPIGPPTTRSTASRP